MKTLLTEQPVLISLKEMRQLTKSEAVNRLVNGGITVYRKELHTGKLDGLIRFTVRGIKECINQPFSLYEAKLNIIRYSLEEELTNSYYLGFETGRKDRKAHVAGFHYFKTMIGGRTAYFNVEENVQSKLTLYTITDSALIDQQK